MGSEEKRYALLIDSDNVSAKYIKPILDELSKYGNVTYKRIYGDWTKTNNASWKEEVSMDGIEQLCFEIPSFRSSSSPIPRVRMRRIRR